VVLSLAYSILSPPLLLLSVQDWSPWPSPHSQLLVQLMCGHAWHSTWGSVCSLSLSLSPLFLTTIQTTETMHVEGLPPPSGSVLFPGLGKEWGVGDSMWLI
jgi:hypothetical protein